MRAIGSFTPMNAGESEVFGFDFTNDLPVGDSITAVAFSIIVLSGTDAAAAAMLVGSPSIVVNQVLQRVTGPKAGVIYGLEAKAATLLGNILALWSPIQCMATPPT